MALGNLNPFEIIRFCDVPEVTANLVASKTHLLTKQRQQRAQICSPAVSLTVFLGGKRLSGDSQ